MLRSCFLVGGCIADVALAMQEASSSATTLVAAATGVVAVASCLSVVAKLSHRIAGFDLPEAQQH
jgi:hypothetical protein